MSKRAPLSAGLRFALRTLRRLNRIATKVRPEQLAAAMLPHIKRPGYCQFLGEYLQDVAEYARGLQAKRVCAECGIQLDNSARADARYCGQRCRQKAYRKRYDSRAKDSDPAVTRYASPPTESERAVTQATERPTMMDALLLAIVCGTCALAIMVDVGMLLTWMMRRWKP